MRDTSSVEHICVYKWFRRLVKCDFLSNIYLILCVEDLTNLSPIFKRNSGENSSVILEILDIFTPRKTICYPRDIGYIYSKKNHLLSERYRIYLLQENSSVTLEILDIYIVYSKKLICYPRVIGYIYSKKTHLLS